MARGPRGQPSRQRRPHSRRGPGEEALPCRRDEEEEAGDKVEVEEDDDSFLLLQQSVILGGSADVDLLVAQIGETLQLDAAHDGWSSLCAALGPPPATPRVLAPLRADKAGTPVRRLLQPAGSAEDPAPPGAMRYVWGSAGALGARRCPTGWQRSPRAPARFRGRGGEDGSRAPWLLGESSSGGGPQAERTRRRTTRSGSYSSWYSRKISSRRRCSSELLRAPSSASAPVSGGGRGGPDSVTLQPSGSWL